MAVLLRQCGWCCVVGTDVFRWWQLESIDFLSWLTSINTEREQLVFRQLRATTMCGRVSQSLFSSICGLSLFRSCWAYKTSM